MSRYQTIISALLMIVFSMTGFAWAAQGDPAAQPKKPPRHHAGAKAHHGRHDVFGPGPHMYMMAAYLDLTREQRDKIQQIWNRSYSDSRDVRYDLLQKRIEMQRLFTDPKVSAQTLMVKEKELTGLQQRLMDRRLQALIEMRSVLTPEQIQKLDEMPLLMGMGCGCSMTGHGGPGMMGPGMGHGMMPGGMPYYDGPDGGMEAPPMQGDQ